MQQAKAAENLAIPQTSEKLLFASTIFLGALLLFFVQPLLGKYILPWYGGIPAVWTACLIFFQLGLLAGYAYAHLLQKISSAKIQFLVHTALLLASLFFLPVAPGNHWKPQGESSSVDILFLLAANVGIPYVLLAASGPLMQTWLFRIYPGYSPFRLFALSNLGSLLALWAYPLLAEPFFTRREQNWIWSAGFAVYVALTFTCAWKNKTKPLIPAETVDSKISWGKRSLWISLAAGASLLLVSITNHLCQDLPSFPLLWVLPLSVYLFTFILCFQNPKFYPRSVFLILLVINCIGASLLLRLGIDASASVLVGGFSSLLFINCMILHGELALSKPSPEFLSVYYLCIAAGGAIGGLFSGLIAPKIFDGYFELYIALLLCPILLLLAYFVDPKCELYRGKPILVWIFLVGGIVFFGYDLSQRVSEHYKYNVYTSRNFFGVLKIKELKKEDPPETYWILAHGGINHGFQCILPESNTPLGYYGKDSGVDESFKLLRKSASLKVGSIGLGVGSVTSYGKKGDLFRIYEINPAVVTIAKEKFKHLSRIQADYEIVLGDARLALEKESPQNFDLIILDAFNSDSIPVHLLTREAFEIYAKHLKPSGILAVHGSNKHLELEPMILGLGKSIGFEGTFMNCPPHPEIQTFFSEWILLSKDPRVNEAIRSLESTKNLVQRPLNGQLWTDDYSNILQLLKD